VSVIWRYADASLRIASEGALCVSRWSHTPLPEQFSHLTAVMRLTAAESGHKVCLFNVVDEVDALPRLSPENRRAAGQMIEAISPVCAGIAHVVLIPGLRGSAVRVILSTLALLVRSSVPVTIHGNLREGARALTTRGSHGHTGFEIEQLYQRVATMAQAEPVPPAG
jgi:hypothetical protein